MSAVEQAKRELTEYLEKVLVAKPGTEALWATEAPLRIRELLDALVETIKAHAKWEADMEVLNLPTFPGSSVQLGQARWVDVSRLTDEALDYAASQGINLGPRREWLRTALFSLANQQAAQQQRSHRPEFSDACHLGQHKPECWV